MSITFTDGNPPGGGGKSPTKKPDPQEEQKERKRKQLMLQQKGIQKKLDDLKSPVTKPIRALAKSLIAQDPNDDPNELFGQVRPLLAKMGLANIADPSKTELMQGKTKNKNSLYKIVLRRSAQITEDTINRIKRQIANFETMQWSEAAINVYVWNPYKAPEVATPAGTPGAPGAPAGVPGGPA